MPVAASLDLIFPHALMTEVYVAYEVVVLNNGSF